MLRRALRSSILLLSPITLWLGSTVFLGNLEDLSRIRRAVAGGPDESKMARTRQASGDAPMRMRPQETSIHRPSHGGKQAARVVLFLLDLATTNPSFVELAESAAESLAMTWGSLSSAQITRRAGLDLLFAHEASEAAFALAAAWRAAHKETYRSVGLRIIRSVAGARGRASVVSTAETGLPRLKKSTPPNRGGVATRAVLE